MLASESKTLVTVDEILKEAATKIQEVEEEARVPQDPTVLAQERFEKSMSLLSQAKRLVSAATNVLKSLKVGPGEELETEDEKQEWINAATLFVNRIVSDQFHTIINQASLELEMAFREFPKNHHNRDDASVLKAIERANHLSMMALNMAWDMDPSVRNPFLQASKNLMKAAKGGRASFAEWLVSNAEFEIQKLNPTMANILLAKASAIIQGVRKDIEERKREEKQAAAQGQKIKLTFDFDNTLKQRANSIERRIQEAAEESKSISKPFAKPFTKEFFERAPAPTAMDAALKVMKNATELLQSAKAHAEGPNPELWKSIETARLAKSRVVWMLKWLAVQPPHVRESLFESGEKLRDTIRNFEREKIHQFNTVNAIRTRIDNAWALSNKIKELAANVKDKAAKGIIPANDLNKIFRGTINPMVKQVETLVDDALESVKTLPENLRGKLMEQALAIQNSML